MAERTSSKIRRLEKSEEQIKLESLNEVTEAIAANKDNILKAIKLIKTLGDAKLLNALNGAIQGCQIITSKFAVGLNRDIYTGLLPNMASMVFLLGKLNVSDLSDFLSKVSRGPRVANQASPNAKTTIRNPLGVLKGDDMNRSLTYILSMLKGISREG